VERAGQSGEKLATQVALQQLNAERPAAASFDELFYN
jgi:hypothetical protein